MVAGKIYKHIQPNDFNSANENIGAILILNNLDAHFSDNFMGARIDSLLRFTEKSLLCN